MSWEDYVEELLKNDSMESAAIQGLNGEIYACTSDFKLGCYTLKHEYEDGTETIFEVIEKHLLAEIFTSPAGNVKSECGLFINGEKFMCVNHNKAENSVYIKGSNKTGGCIARTNKCMVLGLYDSNIDLKQNPGNCNKDCEDLARKMRDISY